MVDGECQTQVNVSVLLGTKVSRSESYPQASKKPVGLPCPSAQLSWMVRQPSHLGALGSARPCGDDVQWSWGPFPLGTLTSLAVLPQPCS